MNVLKGSAVAQLAHVGWGGLLCFILRGYVGNEAAMIIVGALAFVKELCEALGIAFWEPRQTWVSSNVDFLFWLVGITVFALFK